MIKTISQQFKYIRRELIAAMLLRKMKQCGDHYYKNLYDQAK